MAAFAIIFPELAIAETRTLKVLEAKPPGDPLYLPVDEYGFVEFYCAERGCDCRRVMINVLSRHAQAHLATISHAFEPPGENKRVREQTFLDPLNQQSRYSAALLEQFVDVVLPSPGYRQRLLRHYGMFKNVVNDPTHPGHRALRSTERGADAGPRDRGGIIPPPPRRGKRRRGF